MVMVRYLAGRCDCGSRASRVDSSQGIALSRLVPQESAPTSSSPLRRSRATRGIYAHNNIPRTIATSSEITNVQFFIQHLSLHRWFDVTKIVYDDGVRPGKPAPDMYLAAARNIGIAAGECMVVEDAISGLQAAHAAGIGWHRCTRSRLQCMRSFSRAPVSSAAIQSL